VYFVDSWSMISHAAFDDPPTEGDRLERVVDGRDGQRDPRVAAQVSRLAAARPGNANGSRDDVYYFDDGRSERTWFADASAICARSSSAATS
jgi:hypothetical protein